MIGYDFEYNSDFEVQQDDRTDSDNPIAYNNTSITNVNGAKLWTGSSEYSNYVFDAMFARLVYDYNYKYVFFRFCPSRPFQQIRTGQTRRMVLFGFIGMEYQLKKTL